MSKDFCDTFAFTGNGQLQKVCFHAAFFLHLYGEDAQELSIHPLVSVCIKKILACPPDLTFRA